jgi:hypothetical protein
MRKGLLHIIFLSILLLSLTASSKESPPKTTALLKIIYKNMPLELYATATKEGIDATLSFPTDYNEKIETEVFPEFTLTGPALKFFTPTVSTRCESLSYRCSSVGAVFEFWCNDHRKGWDIVGLFQGKAFLLVGKTSSDSLMGFWTVTAIDSKTQEKIGEVQVWVKKEKPGTGEDVRKLGPFILGYYTPLPAVACV